MTLKMWRLQISNTDGSTQAYPSLFTSQQEAFNKANSLMADNPAFTVRVEEYSVMGAFGEKKIKKNGRPLKS